MGNGKKPPTPRIVGDNQWILRGIRCVRQVPEEALAAIMSTQHNAL
jgi:hypothetical protein